MEIDARYFTQYSRDDGRSYDESWEDYTRIDNCLRVTRVLAPQRILVLGTATGHVLKAFHREFDCYPEGCEVSRWAHARIPTRYRSRIKCADMRDYLPRLLNRHTESYDLIFTNSLIYLKASEISDVLKMCAALGRYLHFESSFAESHCPDPYRKTLKPYSWWAEQFQKAGFKRTRSKYLWRSISQS